MTSEVKSDHDDVGNKKSPRTSHNPEIDRGLG